MAFIKKIDNLSNVEFNNNKISKNDNGFEHFLKKELDETNNALQKSEKIEAGIATGTVKDLATATITIQKAEMQMKMMLEVRNKAIDAYKELLKTQI